MRTQRIRHTVQLREERNNGHLAVALRRTNSRGGPVPPRARSSRKRIRPSIGARRHATQSMGVARRHSRQPAAPHRLPGRPRRQPAPGHHARPGRPPDHVYCRVHLGLASLARNPRLRWRRLRRCRGDPHVGYQHRTRRPGCCHGCRHPAAHPHLPCPRLLRTGLVRRLDLHRLAARHLRHGARLG